MTRLSGSEMRPDRAVGVILVVQPKGPRDSYPRGPFTYVGYPPSDSLNRARGRTAARPTRGSPPAPARLAGPGLLGPRHPQTSPGSVEERPPTVDDGTRVVGDTPEPEECRKRSRKALAGQAFQDIELSSRTPHGEVGIGRRRRPERPGPSLLGAGRGHRMTRWTGSEPRAVRAEAVIATARRTSLRGSAGRLADEGPHEGRQLCLVARRGGR